MGAGKGLLSEMTDMLVGGTHVLVDREGQRFKADGHLQGAHRRIRIDIRHLELKQVVEIRQAERVFMYSKHLCGVATCYSLRALVELQKERNVSGVAIALCCHNRCEYDGYVNRKYLDMLGIDRMLFTIMKKLSSWATCGRRGEGEEEKEREERERLGRKAKAVLNWGRVLYLEENNFSCKLINFIDKDTTLENVLLVAHPNK